MAHPSSPGFHNDLFFGCMFLGADKTLRFCSGHGNSWVCLKPTNVLDTKNVRSDFWLWFGNKNTWWILTHSCFKASCISLSGITEVKT